MGVGDIAVATLEVSPALISGLDSTDASTRAATARALGLSNEASLVPAALPGASAQALLNGWILGALATVLALATLAAMVILL